MALTAGLMIAPQLGVGVFVLLLSVGHIGTAIPLMLTWLVIDWGWENGPRVVYSGHRRAAADLGAGGRSTRTRGRDRPARRGLRRARHPRGLARAAPRDRGAALQARWYEVSLAAAAILAYGLADLVNRLLSANGGFVLHLLGYQLAPVHTWPKHAWVTGEGLLALFGAKPQGPAAELAFALLHLAGVALVAWAMCRVARRFLSWPDLISQVLLVAIVLNVLVYVPSTLADATDLNAREFAVVLPFAAVLAGRVLAARWPSAERRPARSAGSAAPAGAPGLRAPWRSATWPASGMRPPSRRCRPLMPSWPRSWLTTT